LKTILSFFQNSFRSALVLIFMLGSVFLANAQEENEIVQDSTKTTYSFSELSLPNPNSIQTKYTYDPITDRYMYTETLGNFNINYPIILTPQQYQELVDRENLQNYYKDKISSLDGKDEDAEEKRKNLLPEFYIKSGLFESIFGGNTIEFIPQGSVEIDLGVLFTKQDNPSFSPQNRSNFTFDFDQRISLSLLGKVGTRLQVNANYDTQSTFDFQNLLKLEYTPTEDDIIQKIEVGNVSMPLNSSLITGAQSLFGVKAELQFGKTRVTGVFSEQRSDTRSVVAQGGGTVEEFEFFIRDYDENRHFFLAQYFRDNYDTALENFPFINSNIQITRTEVWVTNRANRTDNVRNLVALEDLGESGVLGNPNVVVTSGPNAFPNNANNRLDPTNIGGGGSQLNQNIREIATAQNGFNYNGVNEGFDYSKLENARQLQQGQDYVLNTQLGYISLNQRLNNDEVLAVAYQFTAGGRVYQVGEFANDGVNATDVQTNGQGQTTQVTNNALVVKQLKSSITSVERPTWNLMMKNIYDTGAFQLSQDDFRLNIFYNESAPLNYITPVSGSPFGTTFNGNPIQETTLLKLFGLDRLNFNNDPQSGGDGFFDFVPGVTVLTQNGKIIFTKAEPFGRYLFDVLDNDGNPTNNEANYETNVFNDNQEKYVYDLLYKSTKTGALDEVEKNKFQIKGRYKSEASDGIPIGGFNVPRGSVKVTAGGRLLVEGVDYTVNYELGRVNIIDPALKSSNVPIEVSTENNSIFGQQTKRFSGVNVEHQFNENFVLGGTFINLSERPITQKANYNSEPINNTIFGLNGNYSTEVPFFSRLANKLPNIDTDAPSNLSVRGEFAYLLPGAPKGTDFNGEATSYIDDFEGSQSGIDLKSPQSWNLSSRPLNINGTTVFDDNGIENGYGRALMNWYTIDQIFYSSNRPGGITDDDVSGFYNSRVFINELFPQQDVAQGQTTVLNTLDLNYYPSERGPYNFQPGSENNVLTNPNNSWAGITRQITSSDFEQANVEYIEFWLQDPFQEDPSNTGGQLVINLGNISEDILKDGRKQYENGLPKDGNVALLQDTDYQSVVPLNQSLIYAFDTTGQERTNQDVGYDGFDDAEEGARFPSSFAGLPDPANDNYQYYLGAEGSVLDRYKRYNGLEGNSPDNLSDTDRGSTTFPDVEDVNRDNTMNTIDSYFEYKMNITPASLNLSTNEFIVDSKTVTRFLPDGSDIVVNWYQFRIPVTVPLSTYDDASIPEYSRVGGITDFRSIRFARLYLNQFNAQTTMRFGTFDLVRSDWRRYTRDLADSSQPQSDAEFNVGVVSAQVNDGNYISPPGVVPEQVNNNNTIIDQNEQALVVGVCDLPVADSRAVFKNIDVDMRQYKKIRMFIHAESNQDSGTVLGNNEMVGFIRMGNDLTQNYYQIEIPLSVSSINPASADGYWPEVNEINLPLELLQQIKALGISNATLSDPNATFYDVIDNAAVPITGTEFQNYVSGQQRIAIKGNPNFGAIRTLMVGVKNASNGTICGDAWFNELRLSDLDNEGGWAAVLSVDTNFADFANISATGRMSTAGFGAIDQGPQQRSREDVKQYDFVTNVNLGQLLPKNWGIQVPFNYGQGVEVITPEYDEQYKDIPLQTRLDNAANEEERSNIREQSEDYTKRQSINFIGVKKNRTGEAKPQPYDIENFTFNYSYNKEFHRDFEIERSENKQLRTGVNYAYSFQPKSIEPFKKNDSLFTGKYWKLLKEFNFNPLPTTVAVNTDILRQFNRQKFRDLDLGGNNIAIEELFRRNYTFDFQYNVNWNLTKALSLNFSAANNNIVRNYFKNDMIINGEQDPTLGIYDGLFDFGDPNRQFQSLGINYEIPINKIPTFEFINATYSYIGEFQWEKGSDLFGDIQLDGITYDLGNAISNGSTHTINSTLDMKKLYKYLNIKKSRIVNRRANQTAQPKAKAAPGLPDSPNDDNKVAASPKKKQKGSKLGNFGIGLLTSIKQIQINYSENSGTFLPGYLNTPGFIGTFKPTVGYTFGSQSDIRNFAARNGYLTQFPEFNQQYTVNKTKDLKVAASLEPFDDLKIDLIGSRTLANNYAENYIIQDLENNGNLEYQSLTPNEFGNFAISTLTIATAFGASDENDSEAFNDFRANRLIIAKRLASERGIDVNDPNNLDAEGYPKGFGKNNQAVLLPAFASAYSGQDANKAKLGAFKSTPLPNWDVKYTGFMKMKWFKKNFKRFSLTHGYRSNYTINQFRNNLNYEEIDFGTAYESQPRDVLDQAGNYKNEELYSNITITEQFSPLFRFDFEMNNSIKVLLEMQKDRLLTLSFDNNLLTEIQGQEYKVGLGYRIKDVTIRSKIAGPKKKIVSDLNMKADVSVRNNKTIVRYLDLDNNQVTNGQTLYGAKFNADYAFSRNLTAIFYFDYTFSEYAISTAFPQTTIRSGLTLRYNFGN
jgi:cell surface protein SprA